jgi:hypothetical protein
MIPEVMMCVRGSSAIGVLDRGVVIVQNEVSFRCIVLRREAGS